MGHFYLFLAVGAAAAGLAVFGTWLTRKLLENKNSEKGDNGSQEDNDSEESTDVKDPEIRKQCLHCFKIVPDLILQPCGHELLCPYCNFIQLTEKKCLKVCTESYECFIYYQKDEDLVSKNSTSYITDQFSSTEQGCIVCETLKLMVKFDCGHKVLCEDCLIIYKNDGGTKCPECKKILYKETIEKDCTGDFITDWFNTEVKPTFCRAIPVIQHQFGLIVDDIINWFNTDAKPKLL